MKKYNLILLKELCGDDKPFFNQMLDVFISSSLEGITSMEDAYSKNDLPVLGNYAHKIVAPCQYIQAEDLRVLLKEIEKKATNNELTPELADFLLQKVKSETQELIKDLKLEYL